MPGGRGVSERGVRGAPRGGGGDGGGVLHAGEPAVGAAAVAHAAARGAVRVPGAARGLPVARVRAAERARSRRGGTRLPRVGAPHALALRLARRRPDADAGRRLAPPLPPLPRLPAHGPAGRPSAGVRLRHRGWRRGRLADVARGAARERALRRALHGAPQLGGDAGGRRRRRRRQRHVDGRRLQGPAVPAPAAAAALREFLRRVRRGGAERALAAAAVRLDGAHAGRARPAALARVARPREVLCGAVPGAGGARSPPGARAPAHAPCRARVHAERAGRRARVRRAARAAGAPRPVAVPRLRAPLRQPAPAGLHLAQPPARLPAASPGLGRRGGGSVALRLRRAADGRAASPPAQRAVAGAGLGGRAARQPAQRRPLRRLSRSPAHVTSGGRPAHRTDVDAGRDNASDLRSAPRASRRYGCADVPDTSARSHPGRAPIDARRLVGTSPHAFFPRRKVEMRDRNEH